jgi:hypothetical protein
VSTATNKYITKVEESTGAEDALEDEAAEVRKAIRHFQRQGKGPEIVLAHVADELKPYLPEYAEFFGGNGAAPATDVPTEVPILTAGEAVPGDEPASSNPYPSILTATDEEKVMVGDLTEVPPDSVERPLTETKLTRGITARSHNGFVYVVGKGCVVRCTEADWTGKSQVACDWARTGKEPKETSGLGSKVKKVVWGG